MPHTTLAIQPAAGHAPSTTCMCTVALRGVHRYRSPASRVVCTLFGWVTAPLLRLPPHPRPPHPHIPHTTLAIQPAAGHAPSTTCMCTVALRGVHRYRSPASRVVCTLFGWVTAPLLRLPPHPRPPHPHIPHTTLAIQPAAGHAPSTTCMCTVALRGVHRYRSPASRVVCTLFGWVTAPLLRLPPHPRPPHPHMPHTTLAIQPAAGHAPSTTCMCTVALRGVHRYRSPASRVVCTLFGWVTAPLLRLPPPPATSTPTHATHHPGHPACCRPRA
jgi:hypothetical protein